MEILSLVDDKIFLGYLVGYHQGVLRPWNHLVAGHEIEHDTVKLWNQSLSVELIEVYFAVGGNSQELIALSVEYLAWVLKSVVNLPVILRLSIIFIVVYQAWV